jgi:hypothetical protein
VKRFLLYCQNSIELELDNILDLHLRTRLVSPVSDDALIVQIQVFMCAINLAFKYILCHTFRNCFDWSEKDFPLNLISKL